MNTQRKREWSRMAAIAFSLIWVQAVSGQTFSSGSTGADGPLFVAGGTNVLVKPGGVYNHTTVNITSELRYFKNTDNAPVVILATGDVNISGSIVVSGSDGVIPGGSSTGATVGAAGGPGGFNGGNGGFAGANLPSAAAPPTAGQGPGGGLPASGSTGAQGGTYGAPASFVTLTPLFGGSGGGGGLGMASEGIGTRSGGSGAGGGGAILIASSTRIIINGGIRANGGNAIGNIAAFCQQIASAGTGGAIRLVAREITGAGNLQAARGGGGCGSTAAAGDGRIRLEALAPIGFTGTTAPVASVASAPGAVSPLGNPALVNVPTLAIASVGGRAAPSLPGASYFSPDLALAPGTANPIPVVVTATNTPVGGMTAITLRLIPQSPGTPTDIAIPAAGHTGTFTSSSATASVTLSVGQVSVLQAFAAMTLTGLTASLFPLIDGEPVERVMVAAAQGQPSTVSLVTKTGKEVRLDQMGVEDQVRVARAWEMLKETRTE